MWRNYLTVAFRSLERNRTYAFINIFGLAAGLAACLMIFLYVRYERSYDEWLPDSGRIYQVQATWHEIGQPVSMNQSSPAPVRDTIMGGFPQIEAVTVARPGRAIVLREGQPIYVDAMAVDPAFFDIFRLEFVHGTAAQALPNVASVVLTEGEALRQFGTTDALGRTISTGPAAARRDFKVTGVIRDLPKNSHMRLSALVRYDPAAASSGGFVPDWGTMGQYHYVKLRPGADAAAINAALPAWEKRVIPPQVQDGRTTSRADVMDLKLVPVTAIHLGPAQLMAQTPGSDARTVATFAIVAGLILAMACINFVNLSTARATIRAREVALRKVLGASRRQIVTQFLGESVILAGIAMVVALAAAEVATPYVAGWIDADLAIDYVGPGGLLLPAFLLVLAVGATAGLYPALYLSRFEPTQVLKANRSAAEPLGSGRLRNLLVVVQFAVAIGLIASTAIVYSQTRFVQTADQGYEREGLIQLDGGWRVTSRGRYDALRAELLRVSGVAAVARTNMGVAAENKSILSVQTPGASAGLNIGVYGADPDMFATMGMRRLAGRLFDDRHAQDRVARLEDDGSLAGEMKTRGLNVVVNRNAAALLGFHEPSQAIGAPLRIGLDGEAGVPANVVGVVEDTRLRTAHDTIEPLVFTYDPDRTGLIMVRYRNARPRDVMTGIERGWRKLMPDAPFEGAFSEELIARLYRGEQARSAIFAGFSMLAVILSSLGLFGLAAFTTQRRTREIGIRKVLGAKVRDIVRLLSWQFSKPVVLANLVAWPVAWWAMRDWLNGFDLRIPLGPGPFVFAALLALLIALATVGGHAFRIARLKPIHALRYE